MASKRAQRLASERIVGGMRPGEGGEGLNTTKSGPTNDGRSGGPLEGRGRCQNMEKAGENGEYEPKSHRMESQLDCEGWEKENNRTRKGVRMEGKGV